MIFNYKAIDTAGSPQEGTIDALNIDVAISSLQRRNLVISSIKPEGSGGMLFSKNLTIFEHVSNKEIVMLSRQLSTLFSAQVSALRTFRLLAAEATNPALRKILNSAADDLQGGSSISKALAKHPKAFSEFYINMIRSGEESGKLDEILLYLADYLDRTYEVTSKAKNALIYPSFVIFTFFIVMVLMMTVVIPNIGSVLTSSGASVPVYTTIVLGMSAFMVKYGIWMLVVLVIVAAFTVRYLRSPGGRIYLARLKISVPYVGNLYRKLYLARIADNMNTMLQAAIPIVKALEITGAVVGNEIYQEVIGNILNAVRTGSSLSDAMSQHSEIPGIMVAMTKVGEETGELGAILKDLAKFYNREVINAVDTLVDLIEPAMIIFLGVAVGILMASVLIPIYNISSAAG
jgi:type IV pilus assembly protein PilC